MANRLEKLGIAVGGAGLISATVGLAALGGYELGRNQKPTPTVIASEGGMPSSSPKGFDVQITPAPTKEATASAKPENLGGLVAPAVPVLDKVSGDIARALVNGVIADGNPIAKFTQGEWFNPVYNASKANKENDWVGIGPWAPVAFENVDENAGFLKTEGNVGTLVIVANPDSNIANQRRRVAISFTQLGRHQHETAVNGNGESNPDWTNQYTFHLTPFQEVIPFDPDTGRQLQWPDGTPIRYAASKLGVFSVELPKTGENEDVRVGFLIDLNASPRGVQLSEIKIQRGPNDRPDLTGENELPLSVIHPAVPEA